MIGTGVYIQTIDNIIMIALKRLSLLIRLSRVRFPPGSPISIGYKSFRASAVPSCAVVPIILTLLFPYLAHAESGAESAGASAASASQAAASAAGSNDGYR